MVVDGYGKVGELFVSSVAGGVDWPLSVGGGEVQVGCVDGIVPIESEFGDGYVAGDCPDGLEFWVGVGLLKSFYE